MPNVVKDEEEIDKRQEIMSDGLWMMGDDWMMSERQTKSDEFSQL